MSAFIDVDGFRRNRPARLSHLARDLAGLIHPGLPLAPCYRHALLRRYARRMSLEDPRGFTDLVDQHATRHWARLRSDA